MTKYLLSFLVLTSLVPSVAFADVVPNNQHEINNCLTIENQADYQNYNFWLSGTGRGYGYIKQLMAGQNCALGSIDAEVIAIKKTDQAKVRNQSTDENAETYIWSTDPTNRALVIDSNLRFAFETYTPNTNPIVENQVVAHIDSLTASGMTGRTVRVTTKDDSGRVIGSTVTPPAATETSATPTVPNPTNPVALNTNAQPSQPAAPAVQTEPTVIYRDTTNYWVVGELAVFGIVGLLLLAKTWKK